MVGRAPRRGPERVGRDREGWRVGEVAAQMASTARRRGDSCRGASSRGVPTPGWGGRDVAVVETRVWVGTSRDAQLEEIHAEIRGHEIQKDALD